MKGFIQSKFFLPLVVVVIAITLTFLLRATSPEVEEEKNEFPPLVVEVYQASLDETVRSSTFQGTVRAKTNINLISQVAGKVVRVSDNYIEGGQFEADQEIIKIDDADYLVAFRSAEAAVAETRVQLDIELASAENNKREWSDLQGRDLAEASPLRLNKPQVDRARARLQAARAELAQAKLNLDRTSISAPFAGRVMTKGAELGEFVSAGSSVGKVFAEAEMEIRIPMTDTQIADMGLVIGQTLDPKSGPPAIITSKFGTQLHHWPGHLRSIDASIDSDTRLLYATVVADKIISKTAAQSGMPLAPGLFVDVELKGSQRVAGVKVPRTALRNGNRVYVFEDGKVRFREVSTIYTSSEIAILDTNTESTLNAGEMVILSPVPGAFEGMAVEIKSHMSPVDADSMSENLNEQVGGEQTAEQTAAEAKQI